MKLLIVPLMVMGLAVGCSGNSSKAEATATVPAATLAAPAPTPQKPAMTPEEKEMSLALKGEKWKRSGREDKMDGHKSSIFTIYAIDYVSPDPAELPPRIQILCEKRSMFPVIGTGPLSDGRVRLKFDDGPVLQQTWERTDSSWFANATERNAILKGLGSAKTLKFEYSPAGAKSQIITFNTADFRQSVLADPLCKKQ